VVLGHTQRGGTPTAYDRVLSTRYGVKAAELAMSGQHGKLVSLRGQDVVAVDLDALIIKVTDPKTGKTKMRMGNRSVPPELYNLAKVFFG
jgi:6-phosphofructokinase 1